MINRLRLNWFIYETDIEFLGGSVYYTGKVLVKSYRSRVEEAVVDLNGRTAFVRMECFRDGTAVICDFLDENGRVLSHNSAEVTAFLRTYEDLRDRNDDFMEFIFVRIAKQVLTFLLQIICIILFFISLYKIIMSPVCLFTGFGVIAVLSLILFLLSCTLYSRFRRQLFINYHSFLKE